MNSIPKETIGRLNFQLDSLRFHLICLRELNLTNEEHKFHTSRVLEKLSIFAEITNDIKNIL